MFYNTMQFVLDFDWIIDFACIDFRGMQERFNKNKMFY